MKTRSVQVAALMMWCVLGIGLIYGLHRPVSGLAPLGPLFDPVDGLYRTARFAEHAKDDEVVIDGLEGPVTVLRDERGVPHVFAESDRDAIMAFGFVVAQDRLFQLDFIPRVASGRLSEIFGPASVNSDKFLRSTGMEWGAQKNLQRAQDENGLEEEIVSWFATGVNTYIDNLEDKDLPFEFKLFGYRPDRYSLIQAMRLLQYFAFDLTYRTDEASYGEMQMLLDPQEYAKLFPRHNPLSVPIIPEAGGGLTAEQLASLTPSVAAFRGFKPTLDTRNYARRQLMEAGSIAEGFVHGKGSNNWVVSGSRSTTNHPILAGDMHLSLTLPAIWYESHMVTPTMNSYGVSAPGTPLPVEAYTNNVAWAFTNTGADVIDHYELTLNDDGTHYLYDGAYHAFETALDTIRVKGGDTVVDTLLYSHWGPVHKTEDGAIAIQWAAHQRSTTLLATWGMHHAKNLDEFQEALRYWETPMQNIIQADVEGNIAIRSTGYVPLRDNGHGAGMLDGSSDEAAWTGRVPFEELPHSHNPEQGFLTSTNQEPVDPMYPHYLGHDWRSTYRSIRADSLLRGKSKHSLDDIKSYQADVHAVQRDLFVPLLDSLDGLSEDAATLRSLLSSWSGETGVERVEPLVLDEFLQILRRVVWDEPAFEIQRPSETSLVHLLHEDPASAWFDIQSTVEKEDAHGALVHALEATVDTLASKYGWEQEDWRWGDHHGIVFRHLTQTPALRALWRGPREFPGFASTLSPAGGRQTTHSASWRMVVDFSHSPPKGYGVYPGGQSGNPFSDFYDLHIDNYVSFQHFELLKPASPEALNETQISSRITFTPKTQ